MSALTAADIIVRPVISEKSIDVSTLGERNTKAGNKYTFAVHRDANKIQIKQAIEELYAKEKVTFRVEMNHETSVVDLARDLAEASNQPVEVAAAEPGELQLRIAQAA